MEIIGRGLHSGVDGHRLKKKKKKNFPYNFYLFDLTFFLGYSFVYIL